MSHNKQIAEYVNRVHELLKTTEAKNINSAIGNMSYDYAGPGNRFIRQAICSHLTGQNTPLVKAGISHLADYTRAYVKRLTKEGVEGIDYPNTPKAAKASEPSQKVSAKTEKLTSADFAGMVGKAVIRKACKRKGEVTAYDGTEGKITVTLTDGSVRKPNTDRFLKLYNFA